MKIISWNIEKNETLKRDRKISFETISEKIMNKEIVEIIKHPNQKKYAGQYIFIIEIENYIYLVPFVEDAEEIFLKTIIPSRKATQKYIGK
ncbi:BrnT family toxin [bacterium]|nr:BrnT family toxin [bacterium]